MYTAVEPLPVVAAAVVAAAVPAQAGGPLSAHMLLLALYASHVMQCSIVTMRLSSVKVTLDKLAGRSMVVRASGKIARGHNRRDDAGEVYPKKASAPLPVAPFRSAQVGARAGGLLVSRCLPEMPQ